MSRMSLHLETIQTVSLAILNSERKKNACFLNGAIDENVGALSCESRSASRRGRLRSGT